jgi:hypothetical protein
MIYITKLFYLYNLFLMKGYFVKTIKDNTHPCYNQKGLFSSKIWNQFDIIEEYTGEFCKYRKSEYMAGYNIEGYLGYGIDSQNQGNEMKYINHYKNIKNEPNCKYISSLIDYKPKIFLVVTKNININEEILADYEYNL